MRAPTESLALPQISEGSNELYGAHTEEFGVDDNQGIGYVPQKRQTGVWTFWDGNSGNIPARRAKKTKPRL